MINKKIPSTRKECIDLLIADYKIMHPDATIGEIRVLFYKLDGGFNLIDLKLLVSQLDGFKNEAV